METMKKKEVKAQGAETQEVKRKVAPLHAIKSYNGSVERVIEAGVVSKEDGETLKAIGEKMVKQYLGLNMFG